MILFANKMMAPFCQNSSHRIANNVLGTVVGHDFSADYKTWAGFNGLGSGLGSILTGFE